MKDLLSVSKLEQEHFSKSFDEVLCDVDGVITLLAQEIPGCVEVVNLFKQMGKSVRFVSNNSTKPSEVYINQLKQMGIAMEKDDLIIPSLAIIHYLKSNNFDKKAFVIGTTHLKNELKNAGIKLAEDVPSHIEETIPSLLDNIKDDEEVGAVILDFDLNLNFLKLQKALTYIKRPEVLFIAGAMDAKLPISKSAALIGPKYSCQPLIDLSGRAPLHFAKPSVDLNQFIDEKQKIARPDRVLFIGDSISEDMGFATNCGYKKLLVLSGLTTRNAIENWKWPEELKPHYYVDSLGKIRDILDSKR